MAYLPGIRVLPNWSCVMDHNSKQQRRAAEQAFMQSLDQLQASLQEGDDDTDVQPHNGRHAATGSATPKPAPPPAPAFDLESLEEAMADIDQYMDNQQAAAPDAAPPDTGSDVRAKDD